MKKWPMAGLLDRWAASDDVVRMPNDTHSLHRCRLENAILDDYIVIHSEAWSGLWVAPDDLETYANIQAAVQEALKARDWLWHLGTYMKNDDSYLATVNHVYQAKSDIAAVALLEAYLKALENRT